MIGRTTKGAIIILGEEKPAPSAKVESMKSTMPAMNANNNFAKKAAVSVLDSGLEKP